MIERNCSAVKLLNIFGEILLTFVIRNYDAISRRKQWGFVCPAHWSWALVVQLPIHISTEQRVNSTMYTFWIEGCHVEGETEKHLSPLLRSLMATLCHDRLCAWASPQGRCCVGAEQVKACLLLEPGAVGRAGLGHFSLKLIPWLEQIQHLSIAFLLYGAQCALWHFSFTVLNFLYCVLGNVFSKEQKNCSFLWLLNIFRVMTLIFWY